MNIDMSALLDQINAGARAAQEELTERGIDCYVGQATHVEIVAVDPEI